MLRVKTSLSEDNNSRLIILPCISPCVASQESQSSRGAEGLAAGLVHEKANSCLSYSVKSPLEGIVRCVANSNKSQQIRYGEPGEAARKLV